MKKYYSIILMTGLIFTVAAGITLAGNTPSGNTHGGRIEVKADTKNVANKSIILYYLEYEWIVDRGDLPR